MTEISILEIPLAEGGRFLLAEALLAARVVAGGEPRTLWRARLGDRDAACVCVAGEAVFYVPDDMRHSLIPELEERVRWRVAPTPPESLEQLLRLADIVHEAPPDPVIAKLTWSIVDIVRERLGYPGPAPISWPPLVPILNVPIGPPPWFCAPSPDVAAEPIAVVEVRGDRIHPLGFWSRLDLPRGTALSTAVETEFERLRAIAPQGTNGVVVVPAVGPSALELRWMQAKNGKRPCILLA